MSRQKQFGSMMVGALGLLMVTAGSVGAQITVTPDGTLEPNRTIQSVGNVATFSVTRAPGGIGGSLLGFTCAVASMVTACTPPAGTLIGPGQTIMVNVTYDVGNVGTGTVTLRASGPAGQDDGYKTVPVVLPPGAPRISALPYLEAKQDYGRCAAACFAATYSQSTVPYVSLDAPRNVTLVYHGDRNAPKPIVLLDVAPDSGFAGWPSEFQLQVKVNGVLVTFVNGEQTLRFSVGATNDKTYRIGGQFDGSAYTHGTVYPMEFLVTAKIGAATSTNVWKTTYLSVVETANPVARGWTVAGVQRAFVQADGSVLITEGDGSATYFKKVTTFGTSVYETPVGDFSRLTTSGGTYTRAYPDSTKAAFASTGYLTSITDRWGSATAITYDGSNRISQIKDPLLNAITLAYNANGLQSVTDPFGRVTNITVDASRLLTAFADPGGGKTQFGYDGSNRLQTITDRRGSATTFGYDGQSGRLSSVVAPAVPIFGLGTTSPITTLAAWQKAGVPYSVTFPTAYVQSLASAVKGSVTEPGGAVTSFTVNRWGTPAITYQPLSDTTYATFTTGGLPTTIRRPGYPSNMADTLSYNASGLVSTSYQAGKTKTFITYGGWAQVQDVSGSGQPTIHNNLGANGRITSVQVGSPLQTVQSYTYDAYGRVVVVNDGKGTAIIGNIYVPTGTFRNLQQTGNAAGGTTIYTHDAYGRRASIAWPGGQTRHLSYDGLNRMVRDSIATSPATVTRFAYDSLFRVRVTDPKGQVYGYGYNALGWVVADTFPTNRVKGYQYTKDGDLARVTNRRGQTIDFAYDLLHRLTRRTAGANVVAWGRPVANHGLLVVDTSGQVINSTFLNVRGSPDSVQTTFRTPGQTHRLYYGYTSAGLLSTVTFNAVASPTLLARTYSYNTSQGTLTGIQLGASNTVYQPDQNLQDSSVTFPGGDRERHVNGAIGPVMDSALAAYAPDLLRQIGYDAALRIENQVWQTSPVNLKGRFYTYDGLSRLSVAENRSTTVADPIECFDPVRGYYSCVQETWTPVAGESNTYTYDAVGNRTDKGGTYSPGTNRITAFAGWTYNTDLDGNVTNRDSTGVATVFTWNAEGQLTNTTKTGQAAVANYYDANGRLVRKDLNASASSYFLWDGDNLLAEFTDTGTAKVAEYSYRSTDELHALVQTNAGANVIHYAHDDATGSVDALTNAAGNAVVRSYQYDDWGRLTGGANVSLPQADKDRARWKGALWMGAETDAYFMRNRWYEPATGRFLSEDPLGLAAGVNPDVFADSDPTNGADPSGLDDCRRRFGKCKLADLVVAVSDDDGSGLSWRRTLNAIYELGARPGLDIPMGWSWDTPGLGGLSTGSPLEAIALLNNKAWIGCNAYQLQARGPMTTPMGVPLGVGEFYGLRNKITTEYRLFGVRITDTVGLYTGDYFGPTASSPNAPTLRPANAVIFCGSGSGWLRVN